MAKRYYDRALSTNPDAYLAVNLALWKLSVRRALAWLTGSGTHTAVESVGGVGNGPREDLTAQKDVDKILAESDGKDASNTEKGKDAEEYSWWTTEHAEIQRRVETGLLVVLIGVLWLLVWLRRVRYRAD